MTAGGCVNLRPPFQLDTGVFYSIHRFSQIFTEKEKKSNKKSVQSV